MNFDAHLRAHVYAHVDAHGSHMMPHDLKIMCTKYDRYMTLDNVDMIDNVISQNGG